MTNRPLRHGALGALLFAAYRLMLDVEEVQKEAREQIAPGKT